MSTPTDNAIWDRFLLIPCEVDFTGHQNLRLKDELQKEGSGILNWALAGMEEWKVRRLSPPEIVLGTVKEHRAESDHIARWKEERLAEAPGAFVGKSDAYADYVFWCRQMNESPTDLAGLSNGLLRLGVKGGEKGNHKNRRKVYLNHGLANTKATYGQE